MDLSIREAQLDDIDWIIALNAANTPAVSKLSREQYLELENMCCATLIAEGGEGERLGFVMLMAPGRGYDSLNYKWFEDRLDSFLYVDRVAVAEAGRRKGVGLALYAEALEMAEAHGAVVLAAEVNIEPMNFVSLDFHKRLGFQALGDFTNSDSSKVVRMLVRSTLNPELESESSVT